jgi:hypothetical protein
VTLPGEVTLRVRHISKELARDFLDGKDRVWKDTTIKGGGMYHKGDLIALKTDTTVQVAPRYDVNNTGIERLVAITKELLGRPLFVLTFHSPTKTHRLDFYYKAGGDYGQVVDRSRVYTIHFIHKQAQESSQ